MDKEETIQGLNDFPSSEYQTIKRELKIAKNIQTTLLNGKTPEIQDASLTGISVPARLIGGDYYDFYPLGNGKVRIIIGDVMGKGIPAAMLMILTRGAFRSAAESTDGPGETLTAMNKALIEDLRKLKSFVTVFCADWDAETKTLCYANAGHHSPIWIRGKEILPTPKASGVMLGGLPDEVYKEKEIALAHGDIIYFYTDGIIEAQNLEQEQFKIERLMDILKEDVQSVADLQELILHRVKEFTGNIPQKDDITMVILKILEQNDQTASR